MDEEVKEVKTRRPRRTREQRLSALDEKIDALKEERDAKIAKHKAVFDQKAGEITDAYAAKIAAVEEQKTKLQWPDQIQSLLKRIPKDMSPEEVAKRLGLQLENDEETDSEDNGDGECEPDENREE